MNNIIGHWGFKLGAYFLTIVALTLTAISGYILSSAYFAGVDFTDTYSESYIYEREAQNRLRNDVRWWEEGGFSKDYLSADTSSTEVSSPEDFFMGSYGESSNLHIEITTIEEPTTVIFNSFLSGKDYVGINEMILEDHNVTYGLRLPMVEGDQHYYDAITFDWLKMAFEATWIVFITSLSVSILGLAIVLWSAGHHRGKKGIVLSRLDKIPMDIALIFTSIVAGVNMTVAFEGIYYYRYMGFGHVDFNDISHIAVIMALILFIIKLFTIKRMARKHLSYQPIKS